MRTYDNLRQKKQLVTEAMAMIMASETRKQKEIWINLICCRIKQQAKPGDEANEFEDEESSSDEDTDEDDDQSQKKSKKK
jgi:hypothetical protein